MRPWELSRLKSLFRRHTQATAHVIMKHETIVHLACASRGIPTMHRGFLAVGTRLRWTRRPPIAATVPHDVMRDLLTASAFPLREVVLPSAMLQFVPLTLVFVGTVGLPFVTRCNYADNLTIRSSTVARCICGTYCEDRLNTL